MSDVILILGMHRGGTSATAGVMSKLGAGLPVHLMPGNSYNQKGYFESNLVMNLNDKILASAGSDWSDWRPVPKSWFHSSVAAEFKREAAELLVSEFQGSPLFVLKDPRISRLVPFWVDAIGHAGMTPRAVMPVRSPLEVVKSLTSRGEYAQSGSKTHAMLLWLRHFLDAERHSRALPRSIFGWADFRANWRKTCEKISAEAQISWPRFSDRAQLEVDRFLSEELVHHREELAGNSEVHEWVRRAYDALIELSRNPLSNSALVVLDEIRQQLDQSSAIFGPFLIETELEIETAKARITGLADENGALSSRQSAALSEKIAAEVALSELKAQAEAEIEALRHHLQDAQAVASHQTARAEMAEMAVGEAEAAKDGLWRDLEALRVERDALKADSEQSYGALKAQSEAEIEALRHHLQEVQAIASYQTGRAEMAETVVGEAEAAKDRLWRDLEALRAEHDALKADSEQSYSALKAQAEAEIEALRHHLQDVQAIASYQTGRAEMAETAVGEAEAAKDRLWRDLEALRLEYDALKADSEQSYGALKSLRAEYDALKAGAERDNASLAALRAELSEVTTAAAQMATRAEAAESEVTEVKAGQARVQRELEAIFAELYTALDALRETTARADQAEAQARDAKTTADHLARDLAAVGQERELAEAELAQLRSVVVTHQDQLAANAATIAELSSRSAQIQANYEHLERLRTDESAAFARAQNASTAQIEELFGRLVAAEAKASYLNRVGENVVWRHLPVFGGRRNIARVILKSGLFDAKFYRKRYASDLSGSHGGALTSDLEAAEHYVDEGFLKGYFPNAYFDTFWYLRQNEDVRLAGVNPLLHYLQYGAAEQRDPGPDFQTGYYLEANPDVRASGQHPLAHYLEYGRHEGRLAVSPTRSR